MENFIRNAFFIIGIGLVIFYFVLGQPSLFELLEMASSFIFPIIFILAIILSIKKSFKKQGLNFKDSNWQQIIKESFEAQNKQNKETSEKKYE